MLFPLSDTEDSAQLRSLRRACYHALRRVAALRGQYLSAPPDSFEPADSVDPGTRFGSLVFAAQALARSGLVPGPDPDVFIDFLKNPSGNKSIVAFFSRSPDDRSKEFRAREAARVVLPILAAIPGIANGPGAFKAVSFEGRSQLRAVFPILRELAFEFRKPAAILEQIREPEANVTKLYQRFETAGLAGADLVLLERMIASSAPVREEAPAPEFDL